MKSRGTYLVPTLAVWGRVKQDPILAQRSREMGPLAYDTVKRARKIGVKIVAGTDWGYFEATEHGVPDEIAALVKAGLPAMDAIRAGTSVSAECLGVANRVGEIKPGLAADFVAVSRDPLSDISALKEIVLIIHDGDVVANRLSELPAGQN